MDTIMSIDPFSCRMWSCHDRLEELISEETCRDVIDSFLREGQKLPVLARPSIRGDCEYELIYGARRLFAARHLNVKLLARVADIDDRSAFVEMDIENRVRRNISPYERGMSYKAWLRSRHFQSQEELAKTLGLSTTQVSRLMKFSELPAAVVAAFPDARQIREAWAISLAERCADASLRKEIIAVARAIIARTDRSLDAKQTYKLLLDAREGRRVTRLGIRDEIVRSDDGHVLFRVSYRHNDLHVIIRRDLAPGGVVAEITAAIKVVLASGTGRGRDDVHVVERAPPPLALTSGRSGAVRAAGFERKG